MGTGGVQRMSFYKGILDHLGGGSPKYFGKFHPRKIWGFMIQFDLRIFFKWIILNNTDYLKVGWAHVAMKVNSMN